MWYVYCCNVYTITSSVTVIVVAFSLNGSTCIFHLIYLLTFLCLLFLCLHRHSEEVRDWLMVQWRRSYVKMAAPSVWLFWHWAHARNLMEWCWSAFGGGDDQHMQSIAVYGRLVVRAVLSELTSGVASTQPVRRSFHLVTAASGLSKTHSTLASSQNLLKPRTFGDDACFVARHKLGDVIGEYCLCQGPWCVWGGVRTDGVHKQ